MHIKIPGKTHLLLVFLLIFSKQKAFSNTGNLADSLQAVIEKKGLNHLKDTNFQNTYLQFIAKLQNSKPDSALRLCNWVENYYRQGKNPGILAEFLRQKAIAISSQGNYVEALSILQEAKTIAKDNQLMKVLAKVINNEAIQNKNIGNLKRALELYYESLHIKKELNDKKGMAATYGNIANVYKNLYDHQKAIETILLSQKLFTEVNDSIGMANSWYTLASLYHITKKYEQSKKSYYYGIYLSTLIGDKVNLAHLNGEMARLFSDLNQKDSALIMANIAMTLSKELNDQYLIARCCYQSGSIYEKEKDFAEALRFYLEGYQIAKSTGRVDLLATLSESLYKTYKGLAKHEIALNFLEESNLWADSILNEESRRKMMEFQARLEFEDKEKKLVEAQNTLKQESYIQRWVIGLAIGMLLLSLLQSWVLVRNRRKLKSSYERLELANKEIQELNTTLQSRVEERTKNLEKANEILREFSFTNSHKVRKPVANIIGLIDALHFYKTETEDVKDVIKHIRESAEELDKIIHEINERAGEKHT